jgi:hypothetical protein
MKLEDPDEKALIEAHAAFAKLSEAGKHDFLQAVSWADVYIGTAALGGAMFVFIVGVVAKVAGVL